MIILRQKTNRILATFIAAVCFFALSVTHSLANDAQLDSLFEKLKQPDLKEWETVEAEIMLIWSRSGSASVDLLFQRGQKAMQEGDIKTAIEHFTAVVDHAPDFAEGWNMRATAYYSAGLFGAAVSDIRRTLHLNPRHFGAMSGFAMILHETGAPKEALEVWDAVRAIHPNNTHINQVYESLQRQLLGRDL